MKQLDRFGPIPRGALLLLMIFVLVGHICALPASHAHFLPPLVDHHHEPAAPEASQAESCEAAFSKSAAAAASALVSAPCALSAVAGPILGAPPAPTSRPTVPVSPSPGRPRPPLFLLHAAFLI